MYARVATFEGADPARLDEVVEQTKREIDSGLSSPPPGLESIKGIWMLVDRQTGKGLGISLFESEEDLRRGDEALNAMNPGPGEGRRTRVDMYEVALRRDVA